MNSSDFEHRDTQFSGLGGDSLHSRAEPVSRWRNGRRSCRPPLDAAGARSRPKGPVRRIAESHGRRGSHRRQRLSDRRGLPRTLRRTPRRGERPRPGSGPGPRRHHLRHPGTLRPSRSNTTLRRRHHRGRDQTRGGRRQATRTRSRRAVSKSCEPRASRSPRGSVPKAVASSTGGGCVGRTLDDRGSAPKQRRPSTAGSPPAPVTPNGSPAGRRGIADSNCARSTTPSASASAPFSPTTRG